MSQCVIQPTFRADSHGISLFFNRNPQWHKHLGQAWHAVWPNEPIPGLSEGKAETRRLRTLFTISRNAPLQSPHSSAILIGMVGSRSRPMVSGRGAAWLARLNGVQKVASSNLVAPTL